MKTLADPKDAAEIRARILSLTSSDIPQWGIMTVEQMVCHVREAYIYALADTPVELISLPYPPKVVKQFALALPTPWPHSTRTIPELQLDAPGMACTTRSHPFFGSMEHADWMRWGYLHADHHLRQFNR